MIDLKDKLEIENNDDREAAIKHEQGAACVIAGAGTGKTTSLVNRITFLIREAHIPADQILITTFTRKATAELYARCFGELGEEAHKLRITTIDSAIIDFSQQAIQLGLLPSFKLIDDAGQRVLLMHFAWEVFGKKSRNSKRFWIDTIDKAGIAKLLELYVLEKLATSKEKSFIKKRITENRNSMRENLYVDMPTRRELEITIKKYIDEIRKRGLMDYDMISRKFLSCLKTNKSLLKAISSKFKNILVDEFQDTNAIQAEILLLLSGKEQNIWVVGDPCQQIYEWRGAGADNFIEFIKTTKAIKYHLTNNYRSTQTVLDAAYTFLNVRVPELEKGKFLTHLKSIRTLSNQSIGKNYRKDLPIFSGDLDKAFFFIGRLLHSNSALRPCDIVILSRGLSKKTIDTIEEKAKLNGLKIQFHSNRADRVVEKTIGTPPNWEAGKSLKGLYSHSAIKKEISYALTNLDFSSLRMIRSLAVAAETLDSTLLPKTFTFNEAWPVFKKVQDSEISISSAVTEREDAIQVMTIHAAKGLEFPVVLLMKLSKEGPRSFPNPINNEESRLVYVGVTRARDLCVLVHTNKKPRDTLKAFGNSKAIHRGSKKNIDYYFERKEGKSLPPIIAATHLELYNQCPLKFAAYHEGRYLPMWTEEQSVGARIHKALEYYLSSDLSKKKNLIDDCFKRGLADGDSIVRKLRPEKIIEIRNSFKNITYYLSDEYKKVIAIEQNYRYVHGTTGQVEGVVDAILERNDGALILKEWKTSKRLLKTNKGYELQARSGALGLIGQNSYPINEIEIVPLLSSNIADNTISFTCDTQFINDSKNILENILVNLNSRNYKAEKGEYCRFCELKPNCPAWQNKKMIGKK